MANDLFRSPLEGIVMAALAGGPRHGYAVIEAIRADSGGHFDLPEGTVYPILHRLESQQLLSSGWEMSPTGRRRRVYALTRAGRAALEGHRASWSRFARATDAFLGTT